MTRRSFAGAGKTTLLSILCADVNPTSGDAFVCGASCVGDRGEVQKRLGYCPQFDPLLDLLTGREHVQLYARLKGLQEGEVARVADATLRRRAAAPARRPRRFAEELPSVCCPLLWGLPCPDSLNPCSRAFLLCM